VARVDAGFLAEAFKRGDHVKYDVFYVK